MQGSLATRLMKWSLSDFQPKSHPPRSHLRVAENLPEIIMQVGGLVVIQGQQMAKGMAVGQEHEHLLRRADSWKSLPTLHTLHTPGRGSECSTTRFRQNSESPSTQHSPAPGGQSEKASWRTEYKEKDSLVLSCLQHWGPRASSLQGKSTAKGCDPDRLVTGKNLTRLSH